MYPPSHALVRDALNNDCIKNINIKKNDTLYISVIGIHRNKTYWQNANEFIPERFLPENEKNLIEYAYIPFGAGKHSCIGKYMAMPMIKASIAALLKKFTISLYNKEPISPVTLATLKPNNKILFTLKTN